MKNVQIFSILALVAFQLVLYPTAAAQKKSGEGYIILNSMDTLHGLIAVQSDVRYSMQCLFKSDDDDSFQTYTPDMVKEYRFSGGRKFLSTKSLGIKEMEESFLEFLVNGRFSTYAYYQTGSTRFFGRIDDGDIFELKNTISVVTSELGTKYSHDRKEYIGTLNYKMQDFPNAYQRLDNMRLNRNNLVKLAEDYHNYTCPDTECVVYIAEKRLPEVKVGFITTYPLMWVKAPWETNMIINTLPGFGLSVNLADLPLISKRFSFQADILYAKQHFEYDKRLLENYYINYSNELFTISTIRVPVVLKYTFDLPLLSPFLGAGASYSFREIEYTGVPFLIRRVSSTFMSQVNRFPSQMGLNLQAGANFTINKYISIEYAAIFERNGRFFSTSINDKSYSNQLFHCVYLFYKI